jgi:hypothetical protein
MTLLIFVLILIPSGLFISLFASDSVGVEFANHGTKASLVFAAISTLSRLILFQWEPAYDVYQGNRGITGDLLRVLLLPDEVIQIPLMTFVEILGGKIVPELVWIPYLFVTYFTIFRVVGRFTGGSGPYIPYKGRK